MHTIAVRFIPQVRNALNLLVTHELGNLFNQTCLIDLIRQFRNDDTGLAVAHGFDMGIGPHLDDAAARHISLLDALLAQDKTCRGEIRPLDGGHEFLDGRIRIINEHQRAINDLPHIVRRDIGCHTYGDTRGTIDEQLRELGRQYRRFLQRLIIVGHKIHGFLVDILQHELGNLRHANFRITHSSRWVTIDRTEVAVTISQHIAHGEILRHADDSIINGCITMRMIFTQNFADDTRRLLVGLAGTHTGFLHGVEDTAVYRLQAVPHIWQGTRHDNAHRIVDVAVLHLVFQINGDNFSLFKLHNLTSKSYLSLKIYTELYAKILASYYNIFIKKSPSTPVK